MEDYKRTFRAIKCAVTLKHGVDRGEGFVEDAFRAIKCAVTLKLGTGYILLARYCAFRAIKCAVTLKHRGGLHRPCPRPGIPRNQMRGHIEARRGRAWPGRVARHSAQSNARSH